MFLSGVGKKEMKANRTVQLHIKSMHTEFATDITGIVLPSITTKIPQVRLFTESIPGLSDLTLADPTYNQPGDIEVLIGVGVYWKILIGAPRNHVKGQPALQNTKFGWIIGGEMAGKSSEERLNCLKITNTQLQQQLEKFWQQETLTERSFYTKEEKICERHFIETTKRDTNGRFVVRLPVRPEITLGESKKQAQRRLDLLEQRLARQPNLRKAYCEFMREYIENSHMSLVKDSESLSNNKYFIPHQAVLRPDSTTTKLRVVFDASSKTSNKTSLNDKLMPGPNLQRDLLHIILRFRTYNYVVTADIKKMFRQIYIHPEARDLQLILWREDTKSTPSVYRLNTVTYGTTSAPYYAMRCLLELTNIYKKEYPVAAKIIREDCYMDDILTGGRTIQETIQCRQQLEALLLKGQFQFHKWRSNDSRILQEKDNEQESNSLQALDKHDTMKTLGVLWNSTLDQLQYQFKLPKGQVETKREVLSRIAQIFDPLGLLGPVCITGKILMQQLWVVTTEWDQILPQEFLHKWNKYYSSLSGINDMRIQRNVLPGNQAKQFDIFGFSDASERAFGACLYAVNKDQNNVLHANLICSKAKVAPLKSQTIPRLELEAALLLAQLYNTVRAACKFSINNVRLWSDSTVVLGWLQTRPHLLKTFVANRVAKTQELTEGATWQYVPSAPNPADILSRGISVEDLKGNSLWWHGPPWLLKGEAQPSHSKEPEKELPEAKTSSVVLIAVNTTDVIQRYSSYNKLCRIVAYWRRFLHNLRHDKRLGPLDADELLQAERTVLSWAQSGAFSHAMQCLRSGRELPKKCPLRKLHPFLDSDQLIRVGGRITNANLPWGQKHQIVLPAGHPLTRLIMTNEHARLKHCPPEQLLREVRQKFWPISGRREAHRVTKRCLRCFRFKPSPPDVLMGNLPEERVRGCIRPFTHTGVDYAGPFQVRESRRRGRTYIYKVYVAVFICLSTKAVHLEMVSELTTQALMAALQRFTARRGICTQLSSDNGTNFIGVARELKEIQSFLEKESLNIASFLLEQRIDWKFIPPRAPHFGGLWEAAVKSMKGHLYKEMQGRALTFEVYSTILYDIEAIMNSRPLTPLTNDPNDLSVLTPAHFLIGDSMKQPATPDWLLTPDNRLNRWQHLQKVRQILWKRWQREYLQELQQRHKWTTSSREGIEPGMLVLVMEDNMPPLRWPVARIMEAISGQDGQVRVAVVKTATGTYKRAVRKLCPLPMDNSDSKIV